MKWSTAIVKLRMYEASDVTSSNFACDEGDRVHQLVLHGGACPMVLKQSECQRYLLQSPLFVAEEVKLTTGSDIGDVLPQSKRGAPR